MPFAGASQTKPQVPQLSGSAALSTQLVPQGSYVSLHLNPHLADAQVGLPCSGIGQAMPQSPQCMVVLFVSTQAPPQLMVSLPHMFEQ